MRSSLSYSWVIKLMNGGTKNPRINEVQRLINTLDKIKKGKIKLSS